MTDCHVQETIANVEHPPEQDSGADVAEHGGNAPNRVPYRYAEKHGIARDLLAMVIVCVVSGWSSWTVLAALGDKPDARFGVVMCAFRAPVMFAAGKGMRDIEFGRFPKLADFYSLRTPSFDVADIPADYEGNPAEYAYAMILKKAFGSCVGSWK